MVWFPTIVAAVLLAATILLWRHYEQRARQARKTPPARLTVKSREELENALHGFCARHPALRVQRYGPDHTLVSWAIPEDHDPSQGPPLEHSWGVELRVGPDSTVRARYGHGKVNWETDAEGRLHHPRVRWMWELRPEFERPVVAGENVREPTLGGTHTLDGLVRPLERIVLDAGYAWQPVLEMELEFEQSPPT